MALRGLFAKWCWSFLREAAAYENALVRGRRHVSGLKLLGQNTEGVAVNFSVPVVITRKINSAKRRAADKRIAANIRRLQKTRGTRTARQALAEARGERFAR